MRNRILLSLVMVGLLTWALWPSAASAEVKLAGLFGEGMVLQRGRELPVWGWADPGEAVSVTIATQTKKATADKDGKWMVKFAAMKAGGPLALTVDGSNTIALKDILVGEVWLCSGQSNMAMTVARSKNFEKEQQQADYPQIRMFKTTAHSTPEIQADCTGKWSVCSSRTVGAFSASAYFFGRKLHQELGVPIGLINSSWGGTDVAAWTSLSAQKANAKIVPKLKAYDDFMAAYDADQAKSKFEAALEKWKKTVAAAKKAGRKVPRRPRAPINPLTNQNRPANLFNGMIHPLVPYAIAGAIWYQGERNASTVSNGILYETQLKTLITDWRTRWGQGDFQFITVQLPNFRTPQQKPVETTGWVMVRESELRTLQLSNTGIAITTDVGQANDIHPKDKQSVGHRLALWALGTTYERDLVYSGPLFSSAQIRAGRVNKKGKKIPGTMTVNFLHVGDALKTSDGEPLRGFAVAGADKKFYQANAKIQVDGSVVVSSPEVVTPIATRYNWAANPNGNLVNEAGLPAAPLRTDSWDVTKE